MSCVNDYIEDVVTFTALAKIYSTEYLCNTKVARVDEIFVQWEFCRIRYVMLINYGIQICVGATFWEERFLCSCSFWKMLIFPTLVLVGCYLAFSQMAELLWIQMLISCRLFVGTKFLGQKSCSGTKKVSFLRTHTYKHTHTCSNVGMVWVISLDLFVLVINTCSYDV